ncbi:MAG: SDR family oxidoreductase [Verrucomicrobiota bacterium]
MDTETALITGASSGIGRELARLHARRGGNLILVARGENKLQELKRELETKHKIDAAVVVQDLSEPGAAGALHTAVKQTGTTVDFLINNAGFGGIGAFHERDWKEDLAMIQVNIVALTELTRLFLPEMVARGAGRILNVSSTASIPPGGPNQALYFATKHYVSSLSYGIAEELHESPVTVTALLPGATATEFGDRSGMNKTALFDKAATAESVALDGYEAMLRGDLEVVTGLTFSQKLMMLGSRFTPKSVLLSQIRKMQAVD